jgi:hypothetical protein
LIIFACPIPTPLPIHQTRDRFSCIPPFWCGFKIVQENLQPAPHIRIAGGACSDVHPAKFLGKVAWNIPIPPLRPLLHIEAIQVQMRYHALPSPSKKLCPP